MIEPSIAQMLPMMVKTELSKLDETSQANFVEEFNRKRNLWVGLTFSYWYVLACRMVIFINGVCKLYIG